jgi:hypothetical protein
MKVRIPGTVYIYPFFEDEQVNAIRFYPPSGESARCERCGKVFSEAAFSGQIWQVASTGLYYDLECKMIAGIKPQPAFLPALKLLQGIEEQHALPSVLVMSTWAEKRRKESSPTAVSHQDELGSDGGTDGIRTRDLLRDRQTC